MNYQSTITLIFLLAMMLAQQSQAKASPAMLKKAATTFKGSNAGGNKIENKGSGTKQNANYDAAISKVAEHINKASERSREIQNEHMKNVDKDPGSLITKNAMQSLMKGSSFLPQKAGTRSISLEPGQGFNGITNYQPSGWKITETMSGPTKSNDVSEKKNEPVYSYPMGLGPVLLNQCTEKEYTKTSPCYNSKLFDLQNSICHKLMDAAGYIGVGFDGRGFYSPVSRKISLVQIVCANKATFMDQDIPDTMNVFGIFKTEAETKSFQSVSQYMRYIRHKAGLSNQKGLFTSEASKYKKASSFGVNLGGIGAMIGTGIGAAVGGPVGAAAGATLGGAVGGSIEGGSGSGSGKSSSTDKGSSSSEYKQSEKSSTNQGSAHNFFAIMFVKVVLYELTLDEVKPSDLTLSLLKDYMDLPRSYYSIGADVKFQNFVLRWGTHYIRSGKFGGQLKVTKTMRTKTVMSAERFASIAETEFQSMFATLQSSYTQKSKSWGFLGIGGKSKSTKQNSNGKIEKNYESKMNAQNRQSQNAAKSSFTQTTVEAEGGTPEIAESLMDFYTPSFKQIFHDWLISIKDFAKPFEFQLKSIYDLFDISMHSLFPAGNVGFGCSAIGKKNLTLKTEAKTNRKFYMDTRVVKKGNSSVEEKIRVYCRYSHRDEFMKDMNRRRLALERAVGVYMVEGPFPTSSFEIKAGEEGCEEKTLSTLSLFSDKKKFIQFSELKSAPFLLVLNLPQAIPGVTTAQAKYQITFLRGRWFASIPGATQLNLYESCSIADGKGSDLKICFRNILLTYEPRNGFFHVQPRDYQLAKQRIPTLPQWLSGTTVGRPKRLHGIKNIREGLDSGRVAVPCNVKWLNSHRLDPARDESCIHFTAATEGDIFVLFASIPKKHNSWHYLQINSDGVRFYKGFKLEKSDQKLGIGILGDRNLYQSFFVCVSQIKDQVTMQFGKADPDSEVGTVVSSFTYPSGSRFSRLSFYSFASGDKDVSLMDIRTTKNVPNVKCLDADYVKVDGRCMLVCHKECDGCSKAKSNKSCHKCKHMQMEYGSGLAKVTECIAKCPKGQTPSLKKTGLCIPCAAGTFKPVASNRQCTPCSRGAFSAKGATKCTLCSPGSFNDKEGQTKCQKCAQGSYSSREGAKKCSLCSVGTFSSSGKVACSPCPIGKYADKEGSHTCKLCRAGYFAARTGQAACQKCPLGSSSASGSGSCANNCTAGHFSARKGEPCRKCRAGTFTPSAGSVSCQKCPKGTFASREGSVSCSNCPANHFNDKIGASKCEKCDPASSKSKCFKQIGIKSCSQSTTNSGLHSCNRAIGGGCGITLKKNNNELKVNFANAQTISSVSYNMRTGSDADQSNNVNIEVYDGKSWKVCARVTKITQTVVVSCRAKNVISVRFVRRNQQQYLAICNLKIFKLLVKELPNNCAVGQYASLIGSSNTCSKCPTGTYSNTAKGTTCHLCPVGTYANREGSTSCNKCPSGYYSNEIAKSSCSQCPAGTYSNRTGSTSCLTCPAGKYSNRGSASCSMCPAGRYLSRSGSTSCSMCPAGRYSSRSGSTSCSMCPAGRYSSRSGSTSCSMCPAGRYSSKSGTTSCSMCPAGRYSSRSGSTKCSMCPAGTYSNRTGSTSCSNCNPGTYSRNNGSSSCSRCPAGSYSSGYGSKFCHKCPPGKYASSHGSRSCSTCSHNQYSEMGSTKCLYCGYRTYSKPGSDKCHNCPADPVTDSAIAKRCFQRISWSSNKNCAMVDQHGSRVNCNTITDNHRHTCSNVKRNGAILLANFGKGLAVTHIVIYKRNTDHSKAVMLINGRAKMMNFQSNRFVIRFNGRILVLAIANDKSRPIHSICEIEFHRDAESKK